MKKTILAVAVATITAAGVAMSMVPAAADPGNGNGAIVINDGGCLLPVPAEGGGIAGVVPGELKAVGTPSAPAMFTCKGEAPETLRPSKAATIDPIGCFALGKPGQGKITVTPSGAVNGTCHVNPSN